jgi:transcriptional regulator with XRE-family HTH domain
MDRLEALACVLREARLAKSISQENLAHLAKVSRNYVGVMERNGKTPTVGTLFLLADALGIRASVLIARAEDLAHENQETATTDVDLR